MTGTFARFIFQCAHQTVVCPTKLSFNLLSFAVFTWGHSISAGRNLCCESSISASDSFALQSPTVHLEITNSASQMENKGDILCFEEIDPQRWMSAAYDASMAPFFFSSFSEKCCHKICFLWVNDPHSQCWHCADVFLDVMLCRKERQSAVNILASSRDLLQFVSVFKLLFFSPFSIGSKSASQQKRKALPQLAPLQSALNLDITVSENN